MKNDESFLEEALRRTRLSNNNQMEMLSFRLTDNQLYGINVFKIIEIIECPEHISKVPETHAAIKGVVTFRHEAISVIDLSEALGLTPVDTTGGNGYLVVCEYSNQLNAFLISAPDTLLTRSWDQISKPEGFSSKSLVAIAYSDTNEMVLILDIEGILIDVVGISSDQPQEVSSALKENLKDRNVMLVDDSSTAMLMMSSTMEQLGVKYIQFDSALNAMQHLDAMVSGQNNAGIDLIICDIEMPGLDGFSFTRTLRQMKAMENIPIILHSSMSNPTNKIKAEEAGADKFLGKFNSNALTDTVVDLLQKQNAGTLPG